MNPACDSTNENSTTPKKRKLPTLPTPPRVDVLFGDDHPRWMVQEGTIYERPCQTLAQANSQRKAAINKLGWHGKRSQNKSALKLRKKLRNCKPTRPCPSGACPICARAQQRLFVVTTLTHLPEPYSLFGGKRKAISMVPDFGQVPVGGLAKFDVTAFRMASSEALLAAGVRQFLLGLDVSLNHDAERPDEAHWQLQWWGFFQEPAEPWRERLKASVNSSTLVFRPVKVVTPDSVTAAAASGIKNKFKRRISYVKTNFARADRGACRNTNHLLLRGDAWIELMIFLDRIGLQLRVLDNGPGKPFQPLMSR